MAMAAGRRGGVLAEINVTPFADVIVVLLIIFMLVAPVLSNDRRLTLPAAVNGITQNPKPLIVAVQRDGRVRVDDRELMEAELFARLQASLLDLPEAARIVYLKADEGLPYTQVERIIDLSRQAGAEQVALMTTPRVR